MKHIIRLSILLAALFALAACHPEEHEIRRDIVYSVDNAAEQHVTTHGDAEFDALLEYQIKKIETVNQNNTALK